MNTIKITRQNSKCFQCKRIKVDDFLVISNIRLVVWHLLVIDLRDDGTTEKRVENIPPRYHYSIRYILFLIPYFCSSVEWKTSTDISCCVCVCGLFGSFFDVDHHLTAIRPRLPSFPSRRIWVDYKHLPYSLSNARKMFHAKFSFKS